MEISLSPELEFRLHQEAERRGVLRPQCAREILEAALSPHMMPAGPANLEELARQQGAPTAVRFEDLLGDFWPEDESCDEFIAAVREWRREGPRNSS